MGLSKQEKKKILLQLRYPDECLCGDKRTYSNPIGKEFIDSYGIVPDNRKIEVVTYRCEFCGREYDDAPMIATT